MCCRRRCGCGCRCGCRCGCCGSGDGIGNSNGNGNNSDNGLMPVCGWEFICHHPFPMPRSGEAALSERSWPTERAFFEEDRGCGCGRG